MFTRLVQFLRPERTALIVFALLVSAGVGASVLLVPVFLPQIPSFLSPVILGVVPVALAALVLWFIKPAWVLYVTLVVVFLPTGLIPAGWQSQLNRLLTVTAFLVWLVDFVFRQKRLYWSAAHWFFVGFLTWSLVSLSWANDLSASQTMIQVYAFRFILFFLVLINLVRTEKDLDRLMTVLAVIGWVVVVTSISTAVLSGYIPGTRLQVLQENANGLGVITLMALPGVLWKTIRPGHNHLSRQYVLAFVYISLAVVVIALSGSRGSAISLAVTLFALLLLRPTRPWALVFLAVVLLASAVAPFLFTTTIERFMGERGNMVLGRRELIWPAALDLIGEQPWTGVGIGNSSYAVLPYLQMYDSILGETRSALHNPVLVILADTGLPGLVLYLGILVSVVWAAARAYWIQRQAGQTQLHPYFALVLAVFLGFMTSWIKGGGMEADQSYYFMLALLFIPANLDLTTFRSEPQ